MVRYRHPTHDIACECPQCRGLPPVWPAQPKVTARIQWVDKEPGVIEPLWELGVEIDGKGVLLWGFPPDAAEIARMVAPRFGAQYEDAIRVAVEAALRDRADTVYRHA